MPCRIAFPSEAFLFPLFCFSFFFFDIFSCDIDVQEVAPSSGGRGRAGSRE